MLQRRERGQLAAAPGRFRPAFRAADAKRFARHDRRHGVAGVHADGIHHPGHDLGIRVDIGGGDVPVRSDQDADLTRVAAGQVLELITAEALGLDDHPTLGPAVGNPDHGAFPGHPHGECLDLIDVDARVIANAALGGPAVDVVMHPKTGEHLHRVIVHQYREGDGQFALALP